MSDWVTLYTPTTARLGVFVTYHLSPTTWTAFYGCQWLVVFYKWELLLDLPWPLKIEQHKQSLLGSAQALPAWNNMMLGAEIILSALIDEERQYYKFDIVLSLSLCVAWWVTVHPLLIMSVWLILVEKKKFGWFFDSVTLIYLNFLIIYLGLKVTLFWYLGCMDKNTLFRVSSTIRLVEFEFCLVQIWVVWFRVQVDLIST